MSPPIPNAGCPCATPSPIPDLLLLAALSLRLLPHRRLYSSSDAAAMSAARPPSLRFASPQSLSEWLRPRLPSDSLATWGLKPGTKNLHNLWIELAQGETSLADSVPPVRTVHVATVRVFDPSFPGLTLLESHQELSDGSLRSRLRPLSEKMKPGEDLRDAALRGLREELGALVAGKRVHIVVPASSSLAKVEERLSASYPGLPARYVLHSVDAYVEGLPDGEFSTEEEGDEKDSGEAAVYVRKHFWKWVDSDASNPPPPPPPSSSN